LNSLNLVLFTLRLGDSVLLQNDGLYEEKEFEIQKAIVIRF
jgi:hypothetical protein